MVLIMAAVVSVAALVVYLLFMIFLPEWVGITGKTALKNERAHQGEDVEADQLSKFLGDGNNSQDSSSQKKS